MKNYGDEKKHAMSSLENFIAALISISVAVVIAFQLPRWGGVEEKQQLSLYLQIFRDVQKVKRTFRC